MASLLDLEKKLRDLFNQGTNFVKQDIQRSPIAQQANYIRQAAPQAQKIVKPIVNKIVNKPIIKQAPQKILQGVNKIGKTIGRQQFINTPYVKPTVLQTVKKASPFIGGQEDNILTSFLSGQAQKIPKQLAEGGKYRDEIMRLQFDEGRKRKLSLEEQQKVNDYNANSIPVGSVSKPAFSKAASYLNKVADKATIQKLMVWVDDVQRTGGKKNYGQTGQEIEAMAADVFGKNARGLSNKQLANAFDATLQAIGKTKNRFSLGLVTEDIRDGLSNKKIPTYSQANNLIKKNGGYSKINTAPLSAKNRYASDELAQSLNLNAKYLYENATRNNIDLVSELNNLDNLRKIGASPNVISNFAIKLVNKVNPIAQEAGVVKGKIKISSNPTQIAIKNKAEINAGKPDLYTQRKIKLNSGQVHMDQPVPQGKAQLRTSQVATSPVKIRMQGGKQSNLLLQQKPELPPSMPSNPSFKKNYTTRTIEDVEKVIYGSATPTQAFLGGTKTGSGKVSDQLRKIVEGTSTIVGKGTESENPIVRHFSQLLRGFSGGLGKTNEQVTKKMEFVGRLNYGNKLAVDSQQHVLSLVGKKPESLERLHAVLDPELALKKVKEIELTPNEKEALDFLRVTSDFINDTNYKNGFITHELWQKNRGGKYIARAYEPFDFPPEVVDFMKQNKMKIDDAPFKKREGLTDWKQENAIRDPAYLMAKRIEQTMFNDSVKKMSEWVAKTDLVAETPKPNFIKISDHKSFGSLAGKYVRKDVLEDIKGYFFSWDTAQKAYDLLNAYDRLAPRRALKKAMTIYNPAVRLGNNIGNYVFASMNGINPLTFAKNREFFKINKVSQSDPLYRRMIQDGLIGTDVTKSDITKFATEIKKGVSDPNILKQIDNIATESYGRADDVSKMAAMKTWLERGYTYEEAARRVYNGFQNYATVGFLYDIGAKIPVLGNAFVRFQGDLQRIIKNAIVDHPIRSASMVLGWKAFTDIMSHASGESPEDRKTREERVGAPHIPFTPISLEVQTPWGAVNAARMVGIAAYNPLEGPSVESDISRLSPIKSPLQKQNYGSDPLVGPLINIGLDIDFRGKSIKDPNADKYFGSDLTQDEQNTNTLNYLRRSYTPPFPNTIEDVAMAAQGKEDFYGRTRTLPQALARAAGVKVEQYGSEQAQKARSTGAYFEGQDKEFAKLSNDQKLIYKRVYMEDKKAKETKKSDFATYYRDRISDANDLLANQEVLDARRRVETQKSQITGEPLNPFWQLTPQQQKVALTLQTFYPGDETKSALTTANIDWLKPYWNEREQYYAKLKGIGVFKDDLDSEEEYYFKTPPETRELLDQYYALPYGTGDRSAFIRQYPELGDYWDEKREFTNQQRALLGLPALEDKFGFGFGSGKKKVTIKKTSPGRVKLSKSSRKKTPTIKLSKTPVNLKISRPKTSRLKLTTPKAKISYNVPKPTKIKGLTNAVQLV